MFTGVLISAMGLLELGQTKEAAALRSNGGGDITAYYVLYVRKSRLYCTKLLCRSTYFHA